MSYTKTMLAGCTALVLGAGVAAAQETKVIGVSIPAATHGWAGGMNFHAQQTVERLERSIPTSTSCSRPPPIRASRSTTLRT